MSAIGSTTSSLRAQRLRALAPRVLLWFVLLVLCAAGLRAAIAPAPPPPAQHVSSGTTIDEGAEAFATAFARAYLTWDTGHPDARERALQPFLAGTLDEDGGLTPPEHDSQSVAWASVVASRRDDDRTLVTVAAQTSGDDEPVYLDVPIGRDDRGFLYVWGYPALVGPPATAPHPSLVTEDEVEDEGLATVVERALRNYLAGVRANLAADLAPGAVVSLPPHPLRLESLDELTWVRPQRRVAAAVEVADGDGGTWTLRYELEVRRRDRWYVHSLQTDPTFQPGGPQ